ncbi:MAG TPA: hypothetical protein DD723_08780 [Candidatus Omnitrophica bacterium]|nr:MAG: hypothetical protein A2Z81_06985 [Omnitrophica WOR_2 bacterium GWA2_45_18]OGX19075.1 MAG: hypothetical protein A2Y04_04565 [Omnitrophica WOR_2 bacterium GWC2_45_7]HBR15613.1 hypothetical protein [Candidatus Omnitrophota bacterium]
MLVLLKRFRKKYLTGKYFELDESATRLMINEFLSDILGFASLDEIKTEYMIRGTYADYIIQVRGKRYFIVEVKAMPIELSAKHLRQAVNYAANEGIEWALLTNGRQYDFYRIVFDKPISYRQFFSFDLSDESKLKATAEHLQYLTKMLIMARGLDNLWRKVSALDPVNLSKFLYAKPVINYLRRELRKAYKNNFSKDDICAAVCRIVAEEVESIKPVRHRKRRRRVRYETNPEIAGTGVVVSAK